MLHDVENNRDCDVDVDHRNNTTYFQLHFPLFICFYNMADQM